MRLSAFSRPCRDFPWYVRNSGQTRARSMQEIQVMLLLLLCGCQSWAVARLHKRVVHTTESERSSAFSRGSAHQVPDWVGVVPWSGALQIPENAPKKDSRTSHSHPLLLSTSLLFPVCPFSVSAFCVLPLAPFLCSVSVPREDMREHRVQSSHTFTACAAHLCTYRPPPSPFYAPSWACRRDISHSFMGCFSVQLLPLEFQEYRTQKASTARKKTQD